VLGSSTRDPTIQAVSNRDQWFVLSLSLQYSERDKTEFTNNIKMRMNHKSGSKSATEPAKNTQVSQTGGQSRPLWKRGVPMRIQKLTLQTRYLADQKDFYHTTLGLPLLAETTASFTLQACATRLRFQEAQQGVLYHVAFTIPRNTFPEAKSWLHKQSEDEFFFGTINARSLYFCDAANNILEFIVHYDLDYETEGPFGLPQVLHVSEIGLPVEDVLAQVSLLKEKLNIEPYGGLVSAEFVFLGDIYEQLVVVKIGRPWQPTETLLAAVSPMQLTMSWKSEQQLQLAPFPYIFTVVL
jgi:catechol-2,3-dioxygenase